jgi:alpha-tubulin suppressor-like RCC1 family protein
MKPPPCLHLSCALLLLTACPTKAPDDSGPMDSEPPEADADTDADSDADTDTQPITDPDAYDWADIAVGDAHFCALSTTGRVACWGVAEGDKRDYGQVSDTPTGGGFIGLGMGFFHGCALSEDLSATCWGFGDADQTTVPPDTYVQLDAAWNYSCGLKEDGRVRCWGSFSHPCVGLQEGDYRFIASNQKSTCALGSDDDSLHCWGYDDGGEFDFGQVTGAPTSGSWLDVSVGVYHSCAVDHDGAVTCWGQNGSGQTDVPAGVVATDVECGDDFTCVLTPSGDITCWGADAITTSVPSGGPYTKLHGAYVFACAIDPEGDFVCFGHDNPYTTTFPNWETE